MKLVTLLFDAPYIFLTAVLWTILMAGLALHETSHIHEETREMAMNEASTHFKKDKALRHWMAAHGGVYVPIDDHTQANKYLAHVPERDIQTPSGKQLTLMNPAYAMRQLYELYAGLYGVGGHVTSLNLLRPENEADAWEKKALRVLGQGQTEVSEFTSLNGQPFLRYMRPMIIEKACLKCHGHQGYKVGDIRGGLSVSIPMTDHLAKEKQEQFSHLTSYFLLWIAGLAIIALGGWRLACSLRERDQAHEEVVRHKRQLEEVVKKRTAELTDANQKLQYLSRTDGLTTIANRRYFDELTSKEWQRALREETPLALIMADIDYFKKFNDLYGHQRGDTSLKKVAMALNTEMKRSSDFVARYGGEEFAALLVDTDLAGALAVAERMKSNVADLQVEHADSKVGTHLTVSLGVASLVPGANVSFNHLIRQADTALYAAKELGRNQIQFFSAADSN